jgi:hypothetical protein
LRSLVEVLVRIGLTKLFKKKYLAPALTFLITFNSSQFLRKAPCC